MRKIIVTLVALLAIAATPVSARDSELETIRRQYAEAVLHEPDTRDTLLADFVRLVEPEREVSDQMVQELSRLYPVSADSIRACLAMMRPDGSWTDIDYADPRRSSWSPRSHAERALMLARVYQSRATSFYHSDTILQAYRRAINFWAEAKIKCKNWWYNEIGMPKTLGDSYMLMLDVMTPEDIAGAVSVLGASKIGMTGQNRVWLAGVVMVRAILQDDTRLVREAREAILEQVRLGSKEGIQPDWSFHQHGPQQQFGNYGLAFLADMSFYARVLRGTSFALSDSQLQIVTRLMDEGYRWIIWHRRMDVSSLGRQLFHNSQVDKAYSVAFSAQNLGLDGFPLQGNTLVGHRHYPYSDYTIHRRPTWMVSLKMASDRVAGTEYINEDNRLGFYLADGATYYYVRGDEYDNVFPLWNWRLIPGTTTPVSTGRMPDARHDDSRNHSPLVGGVSVGGSGMSAMELNRLGTHAKKAWIFTDRYVLCLGAGLRSDSVQQLATCVDQRVAKGPLFALAVRGNGKPQWSEVEGKTPFAAKGARFHHDCTGYIVMSPDVEAGVESRNGNWRDNMGSYGDYPASGQVMSIVVNNRDCGPGSKSSSGSYMYVVMPDCGRADVEAFDAGREISVLRNDDCAQIVRLRATADTVWVAAYAPGTYSAGKAKIRVDKPGVYAYRVKGSAAELVNGSLRVN